ncbi:MAG: 1-acyl-sn-glycerol-3-phosphate acyltransferase [Pseudomonadota bacterium]
MTHSPHLAPSEPRADRSTGLAPAGDAPVTPDRMPEDVGDPRHIIDILLEERCQSMQQDFLWPLYKAILYPLLRHGEAVKMADAIHPLTAWQAFSYLSDVLSLTLTTHGLEHVPRTGRLIIASTHPTGIADGIAMFDALKTVRPDMAVYANRDAVRAAPQFSDMIIPVEWLAEKRTRQRSRETLVATRAAFDEGRCLVIFPSGRLAYMNDDRVLTEQDWMTSVVSLARKYECDVVPVHMAARNSWLYYWFRNLGPELRDITLFNELLNKKRKPFTLTFDKPIAHTDLSGDPERLTQALRAHAVDHIPAGVSWTRPAMLAR